KRLPANSSPFDELDPVAVRVADEAEPRSAFAHGVRRPLGLDALLCQPGQRAVEVVHGQRDVAVAGAELVGVDAEVVGQLEPLAVARQAHEDIDRLVADRKLAALLEAKCLVEGDRAVGIRDPVAGVDQLHGPSLADGREPQARAPRMAPRGILEGRREMKKLLAVLVVAVAAIGIGVTAALSSGDGRSVLKFDTMAPVVAPYTR